MERKKCTVERNVLFVMLMLAVFTVGMNEEEDACVIQLDGWTEFNIFNNTCEDVSSKSSLNIQSTSDTDWTRFNISRNRLASIELNLEPRLLAELFFEENILSYSIISIQSQGNLTWTSWPESQSSVIRGNRIAQACGSF